MKKYFFILFIFTYLNINAQYFDNRFRKSFATDEYFDVQFYDGLNSVSNIDPFTNDYYQVGIGTARKSANIPAATYLLPNEIQFMQASNSGVILVNSGYSITDPSNPSGLYNAEARSVAELISNEAVSGYVFCGGVSLQTNQQFPYYSGNGDALFGIISPAGVMSSVTALDLGGVEYGGTDIATCIRRSTYNNSQFIMCGYSVFDANPPYSFTKTSKSWIAKLQLTGTILTTVWVKNVDFPNYGQLIASNRAYSIVDEPDAGQIFICGQNINPSTPTQGEDGMVASFDRFGNNLWRNAYDHADIEEFRSIIFTADGLMTVGRTQGNLGGGQPNFWAMNLNINGTVNWSNIYYYSLSTGVIGESEAYDVVQTYNGLGESMYYLGGYGGDGIPTNHTYKILSTGIPISQWSDALEVIINNPNDIDFNGCGIAVLPKPNFGAGVTLFANSWVASNPINLQMEGYHKRAYLNGCRCMVSLQDPCEVWDPLYEPAFVSIIELPQNPWHNYISRVMENTRHDHLVRTLCNPIVIPGGSNQRTSDKLADQFVMSISPNPVEGDDLVVDFESQNQNSITNISITDLNGKVLLITKLMGTRKVTINVAPLNSGIYIIKALSNDQTLRTSKFIKL